MLLLTDWSRKFLPVLLALATVPATRGGEPEFEIVHQFEWSPYPSHGTVTATGDGWFWGATGGSGKDSCGTLFRVRADGSDMQVMHEFEMREGDSPNGSLWNDQSGYLWGSTSGGGNGGVGTIFKVQAATGDLSVVHHLPRGPSDDAPGYSEGGVTGDGEGNLWGTTFLPGTLYKFNIASGTLTTVYDFSTSGSGSPAGTIMKDEHGMLWGVTSSFRSQPAGVSDVYKVDPATGRVAIAARFSIDEKALKGAPLNDGLVSDGKGFVWGATDAGGPGGGGTVFKIDMATGEVTIVASFTGAESGEARGSRPSGQMAPDEHGNLWGTTVAGGRFGGGTIFRIYPASGSIETMHDFNPGTGSLPWSGLTSTGTGDFIGTVWKPGAMVFVVSGTDGSVKRLTKIDWPPGSGRSKGRKPHSELTADSAGYLWGTTSIGGDHGAGTIFKMEPATGRIVKEVSFTGGSGPVKGEKPDAPLVSDGHGFLWSTTAANGPGGMGVLYKVNERTAEVQTVKHFNEVTGTKPLRGLVLDGAGWLWGATDAEGNGGGGTLYKVDPVTHDFRVVHHFGLMNGNPSGSFAPVHLRGNLKSDGEGGIWAAAYETIGTRVEDILCRFDWTTGEFHRVLQMPRSTPTSTSALDLHPGIARDPDGNWWAATRKGPGYGALYLLDPVSGLATEKAPFSAGSGGFGSITGAILLHDRGKIWGVSSGSKMNAAGSIVCYDPQTGSAVTIREFTSDGYSGGYGADMFANSGLIRHRDGHLYGTTSGTGSSGCGFIYRLRFRADIETLPASGVTASTATLRGRVNPDKMGSVLVRLDYSASEKMAGAATAGVFDVEDSDGFTELAVTAAGLIPGMTYYCRAVSVTEQGGAFPSGEVLSFTTPGDLTNAGWKRAFGINDAPDDVDGDGDGYTALLEYALAMSPVDADSGEAGPQAALVSGANGAVLSLMLSRDPSHRDVTISVEAASDPAGPWEELARSAGGAPFSGSGLVFGESPGPGIKVVEIQDIHATGGDDTRLRRFVRVKVQKD